MNKTYPSGVIVNAISYYNLGYTLEEASSLVNQRVLRLKHLKALCITGLPSFLIYVPSEKYETGH